MQTIRWSGIRGAKRHFCEQNERTSRYFISIKVDKEERPDIDSVYMSVCQAFTGSGGWPTTILLTPDQRPFFAGTYFPKVSKNGYMGLIEILQVAWKKWQTDRKTLLEAADAVVAVLKRHEKINTGPSSIQELETQQLWFMSGESGRHPAGSTMYLAALLDYLEATEEIDESFVDTGK